ncbi:MAG: acetyl-CoA hydrolase [Myxococcales bacterium]|nr:acetyl-CoA hydrolase [Myxococcales bacterium]
MRDSPVPDRAPLEEVVDDVIERVGSTLRIATPLGIGKPIPLVDAFYRRAQADPTIDLRIFTALALARPRWSSDLERRLLEPILDRVFGSYPDPLFERDLLAGTLPANVRVTSFYDSPGSVLSSPLAQRSHVSTNYTHVVRDLIADGVNVLAQLVAAPPPDEREAEGLSLSSNPDLTLDLLPHLLARRAAGAPVALVAQTNRQLPFMYGDAIVPRSTFDLVLDDPALELDLFAPPNQPVTDTEYALALNASALVRDGGTIQLGIGAIGDAVSHLLLMRHRCGSDYARLATASGLLARQADVVAQLGGTGPFTEGLYASSEMVMPALLELLEGGVVRREADGHAIHGCFFLGTRAFYRDLSEMTPERRRRIGMTRISFVNQLYGDEERKRRQRVHARFLNTGLVATLLGAVASDGLEDGRVVSGVGGQYNFVAMAHELEGGRSILMVRAVRESGGKASSNIRFAYGHTSIPRHLRDVVVTEYGVADLRGKTDEEVVAAMLQVADSSYQEELLREAHDAGKIAPTWEIPESFRANVPELIRDTHAPFHASGALPEYPFSTDLTEAEQALARCLRMLKRTLSGGLHLPELGALKKTVHIPDTALPYLERMGLAEPDGLEQKILRRAVVYGLAAEGLI